MKGLTGVTAALMISTSVFASTTTKNKHEAILGTQIISVSLLGNLHDDPVNVLLAPGVLSDPINIRGNGTYRVMVTPAKVDPRFGQIFTFVLADANGKELTRMNLGNGATGTFSSFGVQAYIVSIQRGT